ncbi:MAG: enoyl-CoA hydratase [Burkholderiaceae bacterium]
MRERARGEGYETLLVERSGDGFATITLNRPDKLNTLSLRLRQELAAATAALEADAKVHVVILTGAGRAFCAGLDLDEWGATELPAAGSYVHDAVAALLQFTGPVIGAINGFAVTGGVELALACDLLIASNTARFADTHVCVGLLPGWGGSARMVQRIGLARAKELALTGRFLAADEALAWGFVNRVVAPDQLLPEAQGLARQMLEGVPSALRTYKRLLDDESRVTLPEALRMEREASMASNVGVTRADIDARLARLRRRGQR